MQIAVICLIRVDLSLFVKIHTFNSTNPFISMFAVQQKNYTKIVILIRSVHAIKSRDVIKAAC